MRRSVLILPLFLLLLTLLTAPIATTGDTITAEESHDQVKLSGNNQTVTLHIGANLGYKGIVQGSVSIDVQLKGKPAYVIRYSVISTYYEEDLTGDMYLLGVGLGQDMVMQHVTTYIPGSVRAYVLTSQYIIIPSTITDKGSYFQVDGGIREYHVKEDKVLYPDNHYTFQLSVSAIVYKYP